MAAACRSGRSFNLFAEFPRLKCAGVAMETLHSGQMSRFEITVRYALFALLAGVLTASLIYIYAVYR